LKIMKKISLLLLVFVFAIGMLFAGTEVQAEEPWAEIVGESFDLIVGYDAGGSHDLSARYLAEGLAELDIDIDVSNMPGGDATEAAYHVVTSDPDSNILFWGHPPAAVFDPATQDVGYEYEDFDPVASIGSPTFVLTARTEQGWESYEELVEYIEENPGQVVVGGQGMNHPMHYAIEMMLPMDELDYNYVNLGGGADVQSNLLGGHVDVGHLSLSAALPLYEDDELEVFLHTSTETERVDLAPDVPHLREVGTDFSEPHTLTAFAPEGIDPDVREALNAAIQEVVQTEEFQANMEDIGFEASPYSIEETEEFLGQELVEEVLPEYEEWLEAQ